MNVSHSCRQGLTPLYLFLYLTSAVCDVQLLDTANHGFQEAEHATASPPEDAATPPTKQDELKQVSCPA